ncbi:elongation factor 4 [Candidatus Gottesmanbacteria bacterium]|nr:elongation factor 4 [Candidatus Gottesmanbacteria bacterium]
METQKHIRNFAIVAHIDHGKSTLADRLLEATGTIDKRHMQEQVLDSNPIERERGITIKLAPVRMIYKDFILNLIDTPGHVDFSYEVSRSLAACEGILLVVDATQGIQAQTVAHMHLIKDKNLKVIPIVNKIDLPTAKVDIVKKSLIDTFGFKSEDILEISAKTGLNIDKVLEAIVSKIPSPTGNRYSSVRALVFSSKFDKHKGVVAYVRIVDGKINSQSGQLKFSASTATFAPIEIGVFKPFMLASHQLSAGDVGYIATGLKDLTLARVGDTLSDSLSNIVPLPGYKEPKPMVFLSIFPADNDEFPLLRESFEKLHLSDSSFTFKLRSQPALGKGFLCGFLGLLHAEVVTQRLGQEFNLKVIVTSPTVEYNLLLSSGEKITIHSPDDFPDPTLIEETSEPFMLVTIYTPGETVGAIIQLCQDKRGEMVNLEYIDSQAKFTYVIPLSEMIVDFFDSLKSATSGYASLEYEFYEFRQVNAVKMDILINKKAISAFSQIVVREKAQLLGELMVNKLKELLPRQQFQLPIQAVIGGKIVARADMKAFRKDVTQKLYGGDQTRKDKLLEAQKKGKKRMRQFADVNIPHEVFLKIFKS